MWAPVPSMQAVLGSFTPMLSINCHINPMRNIIPIIQKTKLGPNYIKYHIWDHTAGIYRGTKIQTPKPGSFCCCISYILSIPHFLLSLKDFLSNLLKVNALWDTLSEVSQVGKSQHLTRLIKGRRVVLSSLANCNCFAAGIVAANLYWGLQVTSTGLSASCWSPLILASDTE